MPEVCRRRELSPYAPSFVARELIDLAAGRGQRSLDLQARLQDPQAGVHRVRQGLQRHRHLSRVSQGSTNRSPLTLVDSARQALEGDEKTATGLTASAAGMFDQMDGDQSGEVSAAQQSDMTSWARLVVSTSAYLSHCAVSSAEHIGFVGCFGSLSRSHKLCL